MDSDRPGERPADDHYPAQSRRGRGAVLPFLADWLHVIAATFWMGGLLAFPILLLGPLRAMPPETRAELLGRTVRRFTRMATIAMIVLLVTGSYAVSLDISSFSDLIGTPYGRALFMELGLVAFMLPIGLMNLLDKGRDPESGAARCCSGALLERRLTEPELG